MPSTNRKLFEINIIFSIYANNSETTVVINVHAVCVYT